VHKFQLFSNYSRPKILCLGAHADDIEIGCGGTILKLVHDYPGAEFYWVVFSAEGLRREEAQGSAEAFLGNTTKIVDILDFKDSYFPFVGANIKDYFVILKKKIMPDLIFTHCKNDAHQDHQLIAKLTWNAFRDNFIMEYEIPKYDGDLGTPNVYVHLNESFVEKKLSNICKVFLSQKNKPWFSHESFRAIMSIRGIESNSPSKHAEGFYSRKIVF
jgi:LmbE family N-acetylglucosaminyl deacetylase